MQVMKLSMCEVMIGEVIKQWSYDSSWQFASIQAMKLVKSPQGDNIPLFCIKVNKSSKNSFLSGSVPNSYNCKIKQSELSIKDNY